jgi:hypothetical protein
MDVVGAVHLLVVVAARNMLLLGVLPASCTAWCFLQAGCLYCCLVQAMHHLCGALLCFDSMIDRIVFISSAAWSAFSLDSNFPELA